jgi:hypothetical protein
MASELDRRHFRTPCGGEWQASTVRRILLRTAPVPFAHAAGPAYISTIPAFVLDLDDLHAELMLNL